MIWKAWLLCGVITLILLEIQARSVHDKFLLDGSMAALLTIGVILGLGPIALIVLCTGLGIDYFFKK